jgi:hypothetical protein
MRNRTHLLILTGTITPPAEATKLTRTDPALRLRDYELAFTHYLTALRQGDIQSLVFADNSASDVSSLQRMADDAGMSDRVEIISFHGLDHPASYGRGYGEFKLLDHVMQHSRIVAAAPDNVMFWKVTGRYILRNLGEVIRSCPPNTDLYTHCRNRPMYWVDIYVLAWSKQGYAHFVRNLYLELREDLSGNSAEHFFRQRLDSAPATLKITPRFKVLPDLEGHRGYDNRVYQDQRFKFHVRQIVNRLLPGLWI